MALGIELGLALGLALGTALGRKLEALVGLEVGLLETRSAAIFSTFSGSVISSKA